MATPADRFNAESRTAVPVTTTAATSATDRTGDEWVSRRVGGNGVVSVAWQQVSVGKHRAGSRCDVHVDGDVLRFWIGAELVKTAARTTTGKVRKKPAARPQQRA
jgi:hypothetical protein